MVVNIGIVMIIRRVMGSDAIKVDMVKIFLCYCTSMLSFMLFTFIQLAIINLERNKLVLTSKMTQDIKVQMLYQEMLESLEEAIIVIKGETIEFKNHLLTSIVQRIKAFPMVIIPNDISDEKIL